MNTWLAPVFIGVAPWTPVYGGRPLVFLAISSGGSKTSSVVLLAPDLRPYRIRNLKYLRRTHTAYFGKTVAAEQSSMTAAPNR